MYPNNTTCDARHISEKSDEQNQIKQKTDPFDKGLHIWPTLRPLKHVISQLEINVAKAKELIICPQLDLKVDPVLLAGRPFETVENLYTLVQFWTPR